MSLGTRLFLSALLLAAGVYGGYTGYRIVTHAGDYDPKADLNLKPTRSLADFEFTERSGKHVKLSDLEGEIFVVNFFFANCPGSCLNFSNTIAGLQEEFKDADVRFVSVTVDPTTDTPERLQAYANKFGADPERWWFLNAPLGETQELGRSLHVTVVGVQHTDEMVLIDRHGVIRGAFDHKDPVKLARFKENLKALLAEQPKKG